MYVRKNRHCHWIKWDFEVKYECDRTTLIVVNQNVTVPGSSTQWIAIEGRELKQINCEAWFHLWRKLTDLNVIGLKEEKCEKTIQLGTQ